MKDIVTFLNDLLWGVPMILFLVGTHLFLTWKTRFVQRKVLLGIKLSVQPEKEGSGDVSVFGALSTALASTIGTGNIIGVGTALIAGGPGAVFWTWLGGLFGIATKYAETFIAVKFRKKQEDGSYIGGAMTALEKLGKPSLAFFFALVTALCAFGIGCGVQSNAMASMLQSSYGVSPALTGVVTAVLTFAIIFGGIKAISDICTALVPFMSLVYILGCAYILITNRAYLGQTFVLIFQSAFTLRAAAGGFVGSTIIAASRFGIARGLFSNEAGMGSAPIASAAGKANNAVKPALIGSTGVFWDTVVVCLLTGVVLCSTILANPQISCFAPDGSLISNSDLVTACFSALPGFGLPLLVFSILTFAYSTILGWNYYATQCVGYLFGKKFQKPYLFIWVIVIFFGAVMDFSMVWSIADILNALMVIPNVIAILVLRNTIIKDTDYYLYENHLEEKDEEME